ncbi:hypothetical protein [Rickettsia endosymbiont of Ceutorhynchus obstrictus]|uniref:hypothetical protein n=1 Tax=Rickettsia endosymbiont of Ceutorhynchus obstrictus TaxID=3066249 RepID=UPI003132F200
MILSRLVQRHLDRLIQANFRHSPILTALLHGSNFRCHSRAGGNGIRGRHCCMATGIVIARRHKVPTWQSRKKIARNAMGIIIFWIPAFS